MNRVIRRDKRVNSDRLCLFDRSHISGRIGACGKCLFGLKLYYLLLNLSLKLLILQIGGTFFKSYWWLRDTVVEAY